MSASTSQQVTLVVATATATVFTMMGVGIALLQSDMVGRKILSVPHLIKKRQAEYRYKWSKQLEKQMYIAMDILGGEMALSLLTSDEEMDDFLTQCIEQSSDARVLGVGLDERDSRAVPEHYVYISFQSLLYQLPLRSFGFKLADKMEHQLTATALCFVADASSGLGLNLVGDLLTKSGANVPVIREPLWMAQFAQMVEQDIMATETLERLLFGLVRLEAHRVRDQVGPLRTVAMTVAQSTVPSLLPLLQKVFAEERHVFCYDGCRSSVGRAMIGRKNEKDVHQGRIYRLNSTLLQTTPLSLDLTKAVPTLAPALANLPIYLADTTETWMASVDTFLKLKEEEKTNNYLPFVCKMGFLMNDSTIEEGTERYFALSNLLQFITGSRTRPLDDVVIGMACSIVKNYAYEKPPPFPPIVVKDIEDCVFRHKSILIGEKNSERYCLADQALDTQGSAQIWMFLLCPRRSG